MENSRIRGKVNPVKGACVTRANDCGGKWREVKQMWLLGFKL